MPVFAFLSRNGTRIIAASALVGLLMPWAAATLRPMLGNFVVAMLIVSLLRVDLGAFLTRVRRPARAVVSALWITVLLPLVVLGLAANLGGDWAGPVVLAVLFLFSAPPPIVSAPAFAMLMGLDGALVLLVMLVATVLVPLTGPLIAAEFVAETMPVSAADLALRLAAMIAFALVAASALRAVLGPARVVRARPVFDSVSVLIAILFAIGAMDGVGAQLIDAPLFTLSAAAAAFAFMLAQAAVTYLLFRPAVGVDAVAIAYACGNRNAGLIIAGLGATAVDDTVWLFFALSQLPVFMFPLILSPLGRRLTAAAPKETSR